MKRTVYILLLLGVALIFGYLAGRQWPQPAVNQRSSVPAEEREVLYWQAPMDPSYRRDQPGKSPMGMDLVPVYADEAGPGVVAIDPVVAGNLGVRTATAEQGVLSRRIETVGYVGYDEDTLQHIHIRVDGWIENLTVKATGDPVRRGQVLFELYSPELISAQEEFLASMKSNNVALREASQARLIAMGMTESEIARVAEAGEAEQRVRIYAERDGVVAHLGVRESHFITPATNIMSIAQLNRVWVLAEVFERQSAWVERGQAAEVELDYLPGERWRGTVDYVYPELDPGTRTLKVRLRFENPADKLRPNMFARVTIQGTESGPVIHLPREAVIRGGAVDRVVLDLGGGYYRAQPVRIGMESGDRIEIRDGISVGDRVVTSGQFLIDSESNIESALSRLSSDRGERRE
jgi:Cu(I)/Ag(I) efflux system membrane fusion protein